MGIPQTEKICWKADINHGKCEENQMKTKHTFQTGDIDVVWYLKGKVAINVNVL